MHKLLLFFLLLMATLSCSQKIAAPHFIIQKSTQEKWSPGMVRKQAPSKGGIIYQVEVKVKINNASLKFEKLVVGEQVMEIELLKGVERGVTGPFVKDDVLVVLARSESVSSFSLLSDSIQKKIKSDTNVSGWLLYTIGGNEYLAPVKVFTARQNESLNQ